MFLLNVTDANYRETKGTNPATAAETGRTKNGTGRSERKVDDQQVNVEL